MMIIAVVIRVNEPIYLQLWGLWGPHIVVVVVFILIEREFRESGGPKSMKITPTCRQGGGDWWLQVREMQLQVGDADAGTDENRYEDGWMLVIVYLCVLVIKCIIIIIGFLIEVIVYLMDYSGAGSWWSILINSGEYIWVNYNDLAATEPWESWLIRDIIPFYGLNSG